MKTYATMNATTTLVSAIFTITSSLALAQPTNWPVQAGGNGHSYEVIAVSGGITWSDASVIASNRGGYLATITSSNENAFVFGLVSQNTKFWYQSPANNWFGPWLGGLQETGSPEPAGGWRWCSDEPFTYSNWTPGQPNNAQPNVNGGENRIQFGGHTAIASTWNDLNVTNTSYARSYVVEYSVPLPEIDIQQPVGSSLTDGLTKKSFGTVKVGSSSLSKTFTIRNAGTATLSGLAISKSGYHSADFSVGALSKTSLAPGASVTFTVRFSPKATGTRNAAIKITSNDADENPFDIPLTGLGLKKK